MKNLKAKMFNKKASNPNKPDQIIKNIGLKPRQTIADIGAGGGYFTLKFAEAVGRKGRVYAVDTNPGFLEFIKSSAKEKGLDNITTVLTKEERLDLPKESLDFIFMRNVTHHEGVKKFSPPSYKGL
ncbi:MAG: class I SAM-dependent methyltransferase [Thermoplasmata archaeon]|nr:class I SAM-dependent methyltransferase [Thermoplasmata archaeon]